MQENYDKCLETILHHEGGYVNHPSDPGGETNMDLKKLLKSSKKTVKTTMKNYLRLKRLVEVGHVE